MRPQFTRLLIFGWILSIATCSAQDLAELARQEKARRAAAGPVRYRIDNTIHPGRTDPADSGETSAKTTGNSESARRTGIAPKTPPATGHNNQLNELARRGPAVYLELKKFNQRLADLEKELSELERTSTPVWRRGVMVENPDLIRKRREIQTCRRRLQELDQEWRWLQDRARRLGLAPGVLRGSR